MITENLSTLKIHKLTQTQYDRELAAGRIDPNALYLTPEEDIDLSEFVDATLTQEGKAADAKAVNDKFTDLVGDTSVATQINNAIGDVSGQIDSHNSSTSAHTDIRNLVNSKLGSSSEINGGTW